MTSGVVKRLEEFYEPETAHLWLSSPHEMLGGRRPVDLITEGDTDAVTSLIDQLRDGAHV